MKFVEYLRENGVEFESDVHTRTYTAQGLAHAEHVSGYKVAKPVIVKGKSGFTMCVLPAPKHVDLEQVAKALGEKEVRLATEPEMAELFPDCELGAEPPVGQMFGLATVMDVQLEEDDFLIMQAGSHTEAVKVRREDWQRLCKPKVATIATS
jgi:Ala-tRNA(Pro) deacylase